MAVSEYAWFNGGIVTSGKADPSVASNTLHLGIAVFDGIMAYWNDDHWYVHRGDAHLRRFCTGAGRMDLVAALTHEVGHLLGHDHEQSGLMAETLSTGTRKDPGGADADAASFQDAIFALLAAEKHTV